jgi:DNA-binding SARP family transcriptional activator
MPKLERPDPGRILIRQRLLDRLDWARQVPLAWVTGPAGAGKTCLVSSYVEARGFPCLWYSLDPEDADPHVFFRFLSLAAARTVPGWRPPRPLPEPGAEVDIPSYAGTFFEDLFGRLRLPHLVVFDGVAGLGESAVWQAVLRRVLSRIPEGITMVVISREEPPLALAEMIVRRRLRTLRWPDLKLSLGEYRTIVRGSDLPPAEKAAILECYDYLDGWPAGLEMLLRAATEGTFRPDALDRAIPPAAVMEYFGKHALGRLPPPQRDFLLRTCLPRNLTPRMAAVLTGHSDAGRRLALLARKNRFLERTHRGGPVYRYHPLYRQALRCLLREEFPPDRLRSLTRESARVLSESGLDRAGEALDLLRETGDLEGQVSLLVSLAPRLAEGGLFGMLRSAVDRLPPAVVAGAPWLLYWTGVGHFATDPRLGGEDFRRAFALFRNVRDPRGSYLAWAAWAGCVLVEMEDGGRLDPLLAEYEALRRDHPDFPDPETEAQVSGVRLAALLGRHPDHPELPRLAEEAERSLPALPGSTRKTLVAAYLYLYHFYGGNPARAAAILGRVRPRPGAVPLALTGRGFLAALTLLHDWWTGEFTVPPDSFDLEEEFASRPALAGIHRFLLVQRILHALHRGDNREALRWIGRHRACAGDGMAPVFLCSVAVLEKVLDGDLPAALALQREVLSRHESAPLLRRSADLLALAELLVANGLMAEALEVLRREANLPGRAGFPLLEQVHLLLRSWRDLEGGDEIAGLARLGEGLALGRSRNLGTVPLVQPLLMATLCRRALEHGIETEFVRAMVRRRRFRWPAPPPQVVGWPWPLRITTLGGFVVQGDEEYGGARHLSKRPADLLQLLVVLGGRAVSLRRIARQLWPQADPEAALLSLTVTLHRLRKTLGFEEALILRQGKLHLDPHLCWVDTWAVEGLCQEVEEVVRRGWRPGEPRRLADTLLDLYRGPFLAAAADPSPVTAMRDVLLGKFAAAVRHLGRGLEAEEGSAAAERLFWRAVPPSRCQREICESLLACYRHRGADEAAADLLSECSRQAPPHGEDDAGVTSL